MDHIDAEYYLRRCGEDGLARRDNSEELRQRARALAAIDVLPAATAASIFTGYQKARLLRGVFDVGPHSDDTIADDWQPPTIRACGQTLLTEWGTITVHYLTVQPRESALVVTMRQTPPTAKGAAARRSPSRHYRHEDAPDLEIVDDKGRSRSAHFSGSSDAREWTGQYSIDPQLSSDATHITVMGQRVELGPCPTDVAVRVEPVDLDSPVADRAARYLRRCVAPPSRFDLEGSLMSVIIDTYVSCGILDPDAEVIAEVTGAEQLDELGPLPRRGRARAGRGSATTRSIEAKGQIGGRAVGAAVSLSGGLHLAVTDLRATPSGVTVGFDAAVTSAEAMARSLPDLFAMTATDDVGGHYQASPEGWGGGGGVFHGRMGFPLPLSPAATVFTLRIATDRADVVVDIPLRWDGAR